MWFNHNIDLENIETTAGCPEYAYIPKESAEVVKKLIEAGAIPVGKSNLDQFATDLQIKKVKNTNVIN